MHLAGRSGYRAGLRGRWLRAPLLGAAALLLLGNGSLELDRMVRDFDIVAFGAEFDQATDGRLHKWARPIAVYLDIQAGQAELYRRLTAEHLGLLSELTGQRIELVNDAASANIVMVFDRASTLIARATLYARSLAKEQMLLRDALCFGQYTRNSRGEILRAVIGIPSDRAASEGKLPHCIVEETTQALGLPNDSDEVNPSVFNDRSVLDRLTEHDQLLVRLLYDPRLTPGMPRDEALIRAREILRELGL